MHLPSKIGLILSFYASISIARPPVFHMHDNEEVIIKPQNTHTTPWALRADNCPPELFSCSLAVRSAHMPAKTQRFIIGQDACCPPQTTCVTYLQTGSFACCPYGDVHCGKPGTKNVCASPEWNIFETSSGYPFCCPPAQVGVDGTAIWQGGRCTDPLVGEFGSVGHRKT